MKNVKNYYRSPVRLKDASIVSFVLVLLDGYLRRFLLRYIFCK